MIAWRIPCIWQLIYTSWTIPALPLQKFDFGRCWTTNLLVTGPRRYIPINMSLERLLQS